MTNSEFINLTGQWRSKQISKADEEAFIAACTSGKFDELLLDTLESHMISKDLLGLLPVDGESRVWEKLGLEQKTTSVQIVYRMHFLRTAWFRVAVMIVLISSIVAYLWLRNPKPGVETAATKPVPVQNDVMPGGNKAILTLADGSMITLDSVAGGTIAQQSGANIQKSADGEIIYAFDKTTVAGSVVYNTMSTPRGGQYKLILPDGSKVWLNAESSVTFPTAFTGTTREIKMTGEAYFEIKADKQKPFIVKTSSDEILVLGTSFNVNAYIDVPVKTSLLLGSVKVETAILKPGQAFINGKIIATNLEQDLAWKNGVFDFNNLTFKSAMNQFARWYDVRIVYDNGVPAEEISGKMGRNLTLQQALEGLNGTVARFKLEGKTVHVIASN